MVMDIFFFHYDTGKKIAEANYLQGLNSRPAIYRTVSAEYQEKALKDLNKKVHLRSRSEKPSLKDFEGLKNLDKNIANIADSLDAEHIEKLKSEKDYKKIISLLQKPVTHLENYGVDRLQDEYQKRSHAFKNIENDEVYQKCEERYQKLAMAFSAYGHALKEKGDLNSASHYLMKATDLNPYDWEPYYDMASIYEKKGEYTKAINFYRAAGDLSDAGTFLSEAESRYDVRNRGRKILNKPKEHQKIFFSKIEELTRLSSRKGSWWKNLKRQLANMWESIK
jgi:tetratricopeptide (TPR) repeat protein